MSWRHGRRGPPLVINYCASCYEPISLRLRPSPPAGRFSIPVPHPARHPCRQGIVPRCRIRQPRGCQFRHPVPMPRPARVMIPWRPGASPAGRSTGRRTPRLQFRARHPADLKRTWCRGRFPGNHAGIMTAGACAPSVPGKIKKNRAWCTTRVLLCCTACPLGPSCTSRQRTDSHRESLHPIPRAGHKP